MEREEIHENAFHAFIDGPQTRARLEAFIARFPEIADEFVLAYYGHWLKNPRPGRKLSLARMVAELRSYGLNPDWVINQAVRSLEAEGKIRREK